MTPVWLLTLAIFAPLLCGLATLLLPRGALGARVGLALLGPVAALALLGQHMAAHGVAGVGKVADRASHPYFVQWMNDLQLHLQFNPDRLGLFFALLVAGIGVAIVVYARAYFGPDKDALYRFYPSLHLFMTAMLGVALSDSFMLMLLFWEMTSISSFLLIGWERDDPGAVKKAMQAFVTTALGGLVMMGGLILVGVFSGVWSFSQLHHLSDLGALASHPWLVAGFVMIFVGAAAKSAQWPFHFWLPGAMAAPTPVSAYLHSATMVKAGVYLTGRMWPILATLEAFHIWPALIIPLGAVTMVYGAFIALQKDDLKQIFAYTTVSQLGLLMTMYGLSAFTYHDEPNLVWDVTQILNHAMYKAPLFILAGAIGHVASRNLSQLKGFFHRGGQATIMAAVLLLAGYALAAGPFTVSFSAKEMFFYQIDHAGNALGVGFWPLVCAGVATGMFNVAIFVRLCVALLGRDTQAVEGAKPHAADPHEDDGHGHGHGHGHGDHHHETGLWPAFLWIPGLVIVAGQYLGGMVPYLWDRTFGLIESSPYYFASFPMTWHAKPGLPLYMSLIAMGLGLAVGFSPLLRRVFHDPHDQLYPGFYTGVTKWLGPRAFGLVQTGNATHYMAFVSITLVLLFGWSFGWLIEWDLGRVASLWPQKASLEALPDLLGGYLITATVCVCVLLMPMVHSRTSRVLVLGAVGFGITALYYLYAAPDLALTQLSIEIVSLILFLLVLSLLPRMSIGPNRAVAPRMVLSLLVGVVMFWLTLTSAAGTRPAMPYIGQDGKPLTHLGLFHLRNSKYGKDAMHLPRGEVYGAVVDRGPAHAGSFGTKAYGVNGDEQPQDKAYVNKGGGGANVVNVILVDFRGFDTLGEIVVLGLAALGVWTLLRRPQGGWHRPGDVEPYDRDLTFLNVDLPAPQDDADRDAGEGNGEDRGPGALADPRFDTVHRSAQP